VSAHLLTQASTSRRVVARMLMYVLYAVRGPDHLDTRGNIVLFSKNGRTRSPMYLVAYLIIMHCMSVPSAMDIVGNLLIEQRGRSWIVSEA
jgi:hypothetical protein